MAQLITITRQDAVILAVDFVGPLGNYFAKLCRYFTDEYAAVSVEVDFSAVPGFHKSWIPAVETALARLRAMEMEAFEVTQKAEQEAERGYELAYDRAASEESYREEFASFGYL